MVSGYNLRTDYTNNQRTSLCPTCSALAASAYGPPINTTYPLGMMWNDYVWTLGGDLDANNGRWLVLIIYCWLQSNEKNLYFCFLLKIRCVTPEYPSGTYAYFTTVDSAGKFLILLQMFKYKLFMKKIYCCILKELQFFPILWDR